MEKVGGYFQTLYQREEPQTPGLTLATHMDPAKVNEEIPSEVDVEAVVRNLRPHRVGGHTHLRTEHLKQWWSEAYPREQFKTPPSEGALAVSGKYCTAYVAHGGDPTVFGVYFPGLNSKRDHQHTGHRPTRDPVDGGGGADIHLSKSKP